MKVCLGCGLLLPLANFSPHTSMPDGRHPRCKPCRNARQRERVRERLIAQGKPVPVSRGPYGHKPLPDYRNPGEKQLDWQLRQFLVSTVRAGDVGNVFPRIS